MWKRKFALIFCWHDLACQSKMRRGPNLAGGPGFANRCLMKMWAVVCTNAGILDIMTWFTSKMVKMQMDLYQILKYYIYWTDIQPVCVKTQSYREISKLMLDVNLGERHECEMVGCHVCLPSRTSVCNINQRQAGECRGCEDPPHPHSATAMPHTPALNHWELF